MEKVSFQYSIKNIPSSSRDIYNLRLIEQTEKFLKRLRWKAFFYLNPKIKVHQHENFGFKSKRTPPCINEIKEFENELIQLMHNIEFKNVHNVFQNQLKTDLIKIRKDDNSLIKADKTTNFYKLSSKDYDKLLYKNLTKAYKKPTN